MSRLFNNPSPFNAFSLQKPSKEIGRDASKYLLQGVVLLTALVASRSTGSGQTWEYLGLPDQRMSGIAAKDNQTIYVSSPRLFGQTPGLSSRAENISYPKNS